MDVYTWICLLATLAAIALRRHILVRVLCVGFLMWVCGMRHLDIVQAERTLLHVDRLTEPGEPLPELDPEEIVWILQRTPAGLTAFLCAGVLALVPPGAPRRSEDAAR